jgi:hypothetical protein
MTSFIGKRNLIKVKAIWTLMYADERRRLPMESAYVSVPNMLSGLPMSPAASQVSGEPLPRLRRCSLRTETWYRARRALSECGASAPLFDTLREESGGKPPHSKARPARQQQGKFPESSAGK